jgi:cytosine deaminase
VPVLTTYIGATTPTGRVDVTCDPATGLIVGVAPHGADSPVPPDHVDMTGHLVLPGLVEAHAHLDKVFLVDRVDNPQGDLMGAIAGIEAIRPTITHDDIVARATRAAIALSRNGVTSVRTHADLTTTGGLTPLLALLETRRRCAQFIDIEVAMLLGWPLTGPDADRTLALAREAASAGAHVVGGCPHLDDDPGGAVEALFQVAVAHGLPLDFHADENLRPGSNDLGMIADAAARIGFTRRINASHCVSLSVKDPREVRAIADKVAAASVSVTVLPQTNLFLQSRDRSTGQTRAIAPVDLLRESGVNVAAGGDNAQDPFNPVGRLDPLETASLLVMAAHQDTASALDMVTARASAMMHGDPHLVEPGHPADLVFVPASNVREAVAMGPPARTVVKGGRVVTDTDRATALG